ncbi:MAG: hypothetical protein ACPG77_11760 [Nannocystaceae bacterium]
MPALRQRLLGLLTLCLLPTVGCATPADKVLDEVDAQVVEYCDCFYDKVGNKYKSVAACVDDRSPSESERGCVDGLYKDETAALDAHLECRLGVEERFTDCIQTLSCTDFIGLGSCSETYFEGISDCPQPPGDVAIALANCFN